MNLVELAQRIKRLRQERNLTLEQAADKMGLTRSWLSKVENFRVTPSLPALGKIAEAFGISLVELVEGLDHTPELVVVRADERQHVERDNQNPAIVYHSLAFKRTNRNMDPFNIHVPAKMGRKELLMHEGEEFLMVLDGQVDFEHDGQTVTLHAGDCIYFDATVPHRLFNRYDKDVDVLTVFLHHKPT
jgi:transcriptional regulator with XRE-family HTH domain